MAVVIEHEQKDHEFCLRCGRRLRNPQARAVGYGAVCWQKVRMANRQLPLFDGSLMVGQGSTVGDGN